MVLLRSHRLGGPSRWRRTRGVEHSGGLIALDVPAFAVDFYETFGYTRPVFTLSDDMLFSGPQAQLLAGIGYSFVPLGETRRRRFRARIPLRR